MTIVHIIKVKVKTFLEIIVKEMFCNIYIIQCFCGVVEGSKKWHKPAFQKFMSENGGLCRN